MSEGLFAPQALNELRQASVYIARHNRAAGEALLAAALQAARMLAKRPRAGRTRPTLAPVRYRFWSLPDFRYLLVYDTAVDPIRVLRVVHTARDLPTILADLDG